MNKLFVIPLFLFCSFLINAQSNIAHLNSQEVMASLPSYGEAIKKLEDFQREVLTEFQEMKQDFEDELGKLEEMIANGESPTLIQIQEQKLTKKDAAIQQRQQEIQGEIDAYSRELNYPIITKVEKAVNIVADRHNYLYVFDVSSLMIHRGPDITKEVITEVNLLENAPPPQEEIREEVRP
ncbi:MAG: OmpH family outer membrane protein [Crocinitomicaceae bacterium]|nr:OmpH family outer membrane protein [Crocinitomicaceae bacterium]